MINYRRMSGAGNLFVVLDNRDYQLNFSALRELSILLCNYDDSFKAEGLIALNSSDNYDFNVNFYNPDGSSGMMCGNGGRVAVRFAIEYGFIEHDSKCTKFEMASIAYNALISDFISLFFDYPRYYENNKSVDIDGSSIVGDFVDVGTQHFVYFNQYDSILEFDSMDIRQLGKNIRFSKTFGTVGANANFACEFENTIYLRTYERGVEAETGACGTGALSTAYSLVKRSIVDFPVKIIPSSKEMLIIDEDKVLNKLILSGTARFLDNINYNVEFDY